MYNTGIYTRISNRVHHPVVIMLGETLLPYWSSAARKVLVVQPSSVAAERVFSLLSTFSSQQDSSLEDYIKDITSNNNLSILSLFLISIQILWHNRA